MYPFAPLLSFTNVFPGILQNEQSGKKSKTSQQVQAVNNVPSQTASNAQISSLKNKRREIIDLKDDLIAVKNQSRKAFLSYSRQEGCWIVSGSLSFPQKMAIKLGLSDGGYSRAPFNPKSHNIINPGQQVKIEEIVGRLEKSQRSILAEIKRNEMLRSESESDDIGPPPPFKPISPPNNLNTVKPENQSPEALSPVKPPRTYKYETSQSAPIQNTPTEEPPTILDQPASNQTLENREFDELFNSDPMLAKIPADTVDKEFDEIFKYEQTPSTSQDTPLSTVSNPRHTEASPTPAPIRKPRKIDALKNQKPNQDDSLDNTTGIKKGQVHKLTSFWESHLKSMQAESSTTR